MKTTYLLDTNVFLRYILRDHEIQSKEALTILREAQSGNFSIYLDEIIFAEIIWVLTSVYDRTKEEVFNTLEPFITQNWIVNPRKNLLQQSLLFYLENPLSYIDCWIYTISQSLNIKVKTFDKKLTKRIIPTES